MAHELQGRSFLFQRINIEEDPEVAIRVPQERMHRAASPALATRKE
jgi:hypothetical protein